MSGHAGTHALTALQRCGAKMLSLLRYAYRDGAEGTVVLPLRLIWPPCPPYLLFKNGVVVGVLYKGMISQEGRTASEEGELTTLKWACWLALYNDAGHAGGHAPTALQRCGSKMLSLLRYAYRDGAEGTVVPPLRPVWVGRRRKGASAMRTRVGNRMLTGASYWGYAFLSIVLAGPECPGVCAAFTGAARGQ